MGLDGCAGLVRAQRAAFHAQPPDRNRRRHALATLRDTLVAAEDRLVDAVSADFGGRSRDETRLLELLPILDAIAHARSSLRRWMKPRHVGATWFLMPSRAYTICQPLGVVGVMGAWNYPLLLTFGPMISAIAAGNHVILKPSERAPRTATLIAELIAVAFDREYVTVVNGGVELSKTFASLRFDHIVFTGSGPIGAQVMRAASANLTPVTLELGGKSPAIVHDSYPLAKALRRILTGKLYNAGQTCIAPDYIVVSERHSAAVEHSAREIVAALYPRLVGNPDYSRMLDANRYAQLAAALDDARSRGAHVVQVNPAGEVCSPENGVFPPTLVFNAPEDAWIMREEIFGPVLPVVTCGTLEKAISYVNARPRPLALYYFDDDRSRIDHVVRSTMSGGVTINDVLLHIGQHNLPFGGVGPSGMGHYHGYDGFQQLSKKKGVMVQGRFPFTTALSPPFTNAKRRLIRVLIALNARWHL
jgi:coniferyl-aldehyde dehydrogenase